MFTGRFSRQQRLLKPSEFKRVFTRPAKAGDKHLTLLGRKNELGHARLGLAIAKRNIKTAVARNRIKRMVRESFRQVHARLGALDIVVLAKPPAAQASKKELFKALDHLWQDLENKCKDS